MKKIPVGPAVIVLVGPSGSGKSTFATQFSPDEVVSTDALRVKFAGDQRRQDMNDLVFNEFDREIVMRLELGRRVVADATHIRNSTRRRTAKLAKKYGAQAVYVVFDRSIAAKMHKAGWRADVRVDGGKELILRDDETFEANEQTILSGDHGLADVVIDTRRDEWDHVNPLSRADPTLSPEQSVLADITGRVEGYQGILFIGDVHGNTTGLLKLLELAEKQNLFPFSLGDLVDYAPGTLDVADLFAKLMFQGKAAGVLGNHERKIHRWITQERIDGLYANDQGFTGELSHGNDITVNQIKAMSDADRLIWETRFLGMCDLLPHFVRFPRYYAVHGAASPEMLEADQFRFNRNSKDESLAVFGESTGRVVNGHPERLYDWVEQIPPRMTVVVGHDCRCETEPYVTRGAAGGRAVFLDTGSSKPDRFPHGRLSGMALDIEHHKREGFRLVNERFYADVDL